MGKHERAMLRHDFRNEETRYGGNTAGRARQDPNPRQHCYERSAESRATAEILGFSMSLVDSSSKRFRSLKSSCLPTACPSELAQPFGHGWSRATAARRLLDGRPRRTNMATSAPPPQYRRRSAEFDIQQPYKLLAAMHVAFDDTALRRRAGIGNLDHVQAGHREVLHQRGICPEESFEKLRSERGAVGIALKILRSLEEQVECHPERTCALGPHMMAGASNGRHYALSASARSNQIGS